MTSIDFSRKMWSNVIDLWLSHKLLLIARLEIGHFVVRYIFWVVAVSDVKSCRYLQIIIDTGPLRWRP